MPNKRSKIGLTSSGLTQPWRISCWDGTRSPNRHSSGTRHPRLSWRWTYRQRSFPDRKHNQLSPPFLLPPGHKNDGARYKRKTGQPHPAWKAVLSGISCLRAKGREPGDDESQDLITHKTMERTETLSFEKQSLRGMTSIIKKLL